MRSKEGGCSEKPGSAEVVGQGVKQGGWKSRGQEWPGQLRICGYWENFAWVYEWTGGDNWSRGPAQVLGGGLGRWQGWEGMEDNAGGCQSLAHGG